jgi:hypothetical protein
MKTTLEIPDSTFRRAKAKAAERGIPLRQLVTEALEETLRPEDGDRQPWLRLAGGLKGLRRETARINAAIDREFETIEPEDEV